jgi:uncharacterized damage-inducible protein DinB
MPASPKQPSSVEPWLRGTLTDVPAVQRAVLHALELALEDIHRWTSDLTVAELHARPLGLPSLAFQLRHIARSVDRLLTYAENSRLTAQQLTALKDEHGSEDAQEPLVTLITEVETSFSSAAKRIRALAAADLNAHRAVGRKQLPTSVGGLLVHIADHTQRHTGQVVTTAKVLNALRAPA